MSATATAAENITPEQLAQKVEAARIRAAAGEKAPTTTDRPASVEIDAPVTVGCTRCAVTFMYHPMRVGDRVIAARTVCDDCIQAEKDQITAADMKQAGYLNRLASRDRETEMLELLEKMGANPWDHGDATFDRFDAAERGSDPLSAAQGFVEAVKAAGKYDPVRSLYLWGDTGTDKTDLCVAIVKRLVELDYPPRGIVFDNAAELIARIQDTYGRKESSTMDVLEVRFNASLWILDDFGTERASDDVIRHLTLIFTKRGMRPNLVTSNFSPEQLDRERPEFFRVLSRLGPKYFRKAELRGRDRRFD